MKYLLIALSLLPSAAQAQPWQHRSVVPPYQPSGPSVQEQMARGAAEQIEMPVYCDGQPMTALDCKRQQDARTKAMLDDLQYQGEVTRWLFNYMTTK